MHAPSLIPPIRRRRDHEPGQSSFEAAALSNGAPPRPNEPQGVRFVSFSVDPDRDTPDALREYARRWAPDETRWTLLATTKQTLAAVVAGMKTFVQTQSDPNSELHTSEFFLVDGQGRLRGLYDTNVVSSAQLLAHIHRLLSELNGAARLAPVTTAEATADGASLYRRLGCAGCHDVPSIAPRWPGSPDAR